MNQESLTIERFMQGIKATKEMETIVSAVSLSTEERERYRQLFFQNREVFFSSVKKQENYPFLFLKLYLDFAKDAYRVYKKKGISDKIYFDTFSDITVWVNNYIQDYGKIGLKEYDWIWRHITLKLFRLGRLQFEIVKGEEEPFVNQREINPGGRILNLHIPQGQALQYDDCIKSLKQAADFFEEYQEITCHSWLLAPALKEILPKDSNILKFQTLFEIYGLDKQSREAEERVFGRVRGSIAEYPEKTFLQRELKRYLLSGKEMGSAFGKIKNVLIN